MLHLIKFAYLFLFVHVVTPGLFSSQLWHVFSWPLGLLHAEDLAFGKLSFSARHGGGTHLQSKPWERGLCELQNESLSETQMSNYGSKHASMQTKPSLNFLHLPGAHHLCSCEECRWPPSRMTQPASQEPGQHLVGSIYETRSLLYTVHKPAPSAIKK